MDSSTAPMNMDGQNSMIEDDIYSCSSAVSMTQLNSQNLNHQGFMNEFPALCMIQGEFINHLQWHPHLKYHEDNATSNALTHRSSHLDRVNDKDISMGRSYPVTDIDNQVHYMTTMPNFAASHATLLNTSGKETPAPSVCPQEVMETFVSNDYFDPRRSSLGTFGNHGYNERLGNLRSKRDLHNNVAEFSQRVHERTGLEPFKIVGDMDQNEWISAENTSMSSDYTSGSSKYSNELSPSLCISQSAVISATSFPEHRSEMNCTGLCNYSLSEKRMDSEQASCNTNNSSPTFNYQPVQLSCLSSGSKFLRAVQEILSELATYCFDNSGRGSCFSRSTGNSITFSCSSEDAERNYSSMDPVSSYDGDYLTVRGQEVQTRKNLLDLLQMVDDQYSQCLAEIHKVISAYHAVTELDPHIHARFALQTVDLLYKNLRERINTSVLALGARILEGGKKAEEISFEPSFIQKQWALQQLRRKDHQLWRPQRGLPERSVSVLRAWMFQNFLHPYPKDAEKHLLAVKSGLTRSQVSNWFINARVRLWKPMIDEMYSEMSRRKAHQNGEETESNRRNLISIDGHVFRMI